MPRIVIIYKFGFMIIFRKINNALEGNEKL